jgi:hypothetical protein
MGISLRPKRHIFAKAAACYALLCLLILFSHNRLHVKPLDEKNLAQQQSFYDLSNVSESVHLHKRARPPLSFDQAENKGRALVCLMETTQTGANQITANNNFPVTTPYTQYSDLGRFGWVKSQQTEPGFEDELDSVFTAIGLTLANNVFVRWDQTQDVTVNGVFYLVSPLSSEKNDHSAKALFITI